jgi:hypothetical protein
MNKLINTKPEQPGRETKEHDRDPEEFCALSLTQR